MGFFAAVDGLPPEVVEAQERKFNRLKAESDQAERALRAELAPEARRAGVPLDQLVQLVKLKHLAPEEFQRLHREVNQKAAQQEAALERLKHAARGLEASIEKEKRDHGESMQVIAARVQLADLRKKIRQHGRS
jgi:hypothetical protein